MFILIASCVSVLADVRSECLANRQVTVDISTSKGGSGAGVGGTGAGAVAGTIAGGYLASVTVLDEHIATEICPLVIVAKPWQRLAITVYTFGSGVTLPGDTQASSQMDTVASSKTGSGGVSYYFVRDFSFLLK